MTLGVTKLQVNIIGQARTSVRLLALFLRGVLPLLACSCRAPTWEQDFAEAAVVFRGSITSVKRVSGGPVDRIILRFAVLTTWKGPGGRSVIMHSEIEQAACWGFWPDLVKVGNNVVVFAFEQPRDWLQWHKVPEFPKDQRTVLTTSVCSHTSRWSREIQSIMIQRFGPGR